jgi:hypothetical protein
MNFKKKFLFHTLKNVMGGVAFFLLFLPMATNAGTVLDAKKVMYGDDIDDDLIEVYKIKYRGYIAQPDTDEVIEKRRLNSQTYQNNDGSLTTRLYASNIFEKLNDRYYEINYQYRPIQQFEEYLETGIDKFYEPIKKINFFATPAHAQTDITASTSDVGLKWEVTGANKTNFLAGVGADGTSNTALLEATYLVIKGLETRFDEQTIIRSGMCYDTSVIDGTIGTSSLFLYLGSRSVDVVEATTTGTWLYSWTPEDPESIATTDYDNFGDVIDIKLNAELTDGVYNEFVATSTTYNTEGWTCFMIREGFDVKAWFHPDAPTGVRTQYNYHSTSNTNAPYLQINWEEATTTPPTVELPDDMPLSNDILVITGMTEHYETDTNTPDWIEHHYYRVSAIFLFFIVIVVFVNLYIIREYFKYKNSYVKTRKKK